MWELLTGIASYFIQITVVRGDLLKLMYNVHFSTICYKSAVSLSIKMKALFCSGSVSEKEQNFGW